MKGLNNLKAIFVDHKRRGRRMANEKHLSDADKPNKQSTHSTTRNMCNDNNNKINRGNYVQRMASQLLNASSPTSCTQRNQLIINEETKKQQQAHHKNLIATTTTTTNQSTFRTAIEDLKKIMNNQEFKQLNHHRQTAESNQIYSKVNKQPTDRSLIQQRHGSEREEENKSLLNLNGNFQVEETEHGIQIQIKQPHLISVICSQEKLKQNQKQKLEDDKEMPRTSIRIFPLKLGRNTIGSAQGNDIILNEPFVQSEHCYIDLELRASTSHHRTNDGQQKKKQQNLLVTFYPLAGLSAIDGVLIDNPYRLNTGKNHLYIYFKCLLAEKLN